MPASVIIQALIATLMWGTAFPVAKTALQFVGPITMAGLRMTIAGLLLLASSLVFRSVVDTTRAAKPILWKRVLTIGILSTATFYGLLFLGMARTSGASGAAMDAAGPVITATVAHFALHDDRLSIRRGLAILIAFAGVFIIAMSRSSSAASVIDPLGCALILLGLSFNSAGTMLVVTYRGRLSLERLTGTQMTFGGSILLVIGWLQEQPLTHLRAPAQFWMCLFWLSIVSAVAFRIWYGLIRRYKVTSLTVFSFLTGVWGVLLCAVFLRDPLTLQFLVGLVAVIGGVILMNSEKISHRRKVPADA